VAEGAGYEVAAADVGHSLSCQLSAANAAGSADATSAAVLARAPSAVQCVVPALKGLSLAAARRALADDNCKLGKAHKPKHRRKHAKLVVSRQSKRPGTTLEAGAEISVKLVAKKR
jgi:hypothetical protein